MQTISALAQPYTPADYVAAAGVAGAGVAQYAREFLFCTQKWLHIGQKF